MNKMSKKNEPSIYKIENKKNGKAYIGSTTNYEGRINSHIKSLDEGKHHNYKLQSDWKLYSKESFTFNKIYEADEEYQLPFMEKAFINQHKLSNYVYNISDPVADEDIKSRKKKTKKKNTRYRISQKQIIEYMNKNHQHKLIELEKYLKSNFYYRREKVDLWFIDNVEDEAVRSELNARDALKGWYNKNRLVVIKSPILRKEMKKCGIKDVPNEELIVDEYLSTLLWGRVKGRRVRHTITDEEWEYMKKLNLKDIV